MKAKLEFNLPEERDEFTLASNGGNFWSSLWDLDQWLRAKIKYGVDLEDYEIEIYEKIRDELHQKMDENRVFLDMVE